MWRGEQSEGSGAVSFLSTTKIPTIICCLQTPSEAKTYSLPHPPLANNHMAVDEWRLVEDGVLALTPNKTNCG